MAMEILQSIDTGISIAALIICLICLVAELGKLRKKPVNPWEKFIKNGGFAGIKEAEKERDQ